MAEEKVNLSKGGIAVVCYSTTGYVKEFSNHQQVVFIDSREIPGTQLADLVPQQDTKVVIITEGLPKYHYTWFTSFCGTKKIPYLIRRSNDAVYNTLKEMFRDGIAEGKPSQEEVIKSQTHGKLNPLKELIDFTKSNVENARVMMARARVLGITTNENSLQQLVSSERRKQSGTGLPKSARPKLDLSVDLLDEMIRNLTDMRDFLIATCEENRLLKNKLDKFKKAMEE